MNTENTPPNSLDKLQRVQKLLAKLREFRDNPKCYGHPLYGVVGNLIGEFKEIERLLDSPTTRSELLSTEQIRSVKEIVEAYNTDPVIAAYFMSKSEWKDKIDDLKNSARVVFDWRDYDD
jgi:hypothetical protein